jgi:hypothetical protein
VFLSANVKEKVQTVFEGDGLCLITEQRVVNLALLALLDLLNPKNARA